MAAQEYEEVSHLRPACVDCTHRCNQLHGGHDREEEKFDPDRSWPYFGRKVTKLALHHSPQAALCIPGTFTQEYPTSVQKGKPITLEGPSGNQWTVGATERSVLYPGWRAFAHDHRLQEGDQLHFRLTSPSHFVVDIFNSHGEVRRSARRAVVTGRYAAPNTPPRQDQSRKRKGDMADLAALGKSARSRVVDRWNTPARNGSSFNESTPKLQFSEKTKQWESHEVKDARAARAAQAAREEQVVTIDLDSDKEEPLVARSTKLERLIEFMKEEEEAKFTVQKSKAFATRVTEDQKAADAKNHQEIPNDGEVAYVAEGNEATDEKEKQRPSDNPFRHFTTMFDTTPMESHEDLQEMEEVSFGKAVFKAEKEKKLDSASNSLSQEAQPLRDEDVGMMKEKEMEDETYLARSFEHLELDKFTPQACMIEKKKLEISVAEWDTAPEEEGHEDLEAGKATLLPSTEQQLGTIDNRIDAQMLHSYKISLPHEAAALDYESVTHKASQVTKSTCTSVTAMSEMHENTDNNMAEDGNGRPSQMQEAGAGFFLGSAPNTVVEYSVIMNTVNEDLADNVTPLKQGLKRTNDLNTLKPTEDEELDLSKSKNSSCLFEAQEIKTEPGMAREDNSNMPVQREGKIEKAAVLPSNYLNPEFTTPASEKDSTIQARVAPTTNTCVLGSKRGPVFQADREKALKGAQAWAQRILNPNFVVVMKSSYVYTDFNMDIPAGFAKQAKLPETELRVTLVCDEVPTNCKGIWVGSKAQIDSKGWMNFSRSHCLEEGDVCVFECFTTTTSFRLGVYIFRVVKLKRPILHDWTRHYKILECTDAAAAGAQTRSEEKVP